MKKFSLLLLTLTIASLQLQAQDRYLEPVFESVTVTTDVEYAINYTVLLLTVTGHTEPQQLMCDIYEPEGDDETQRPLVIINATGFFLPPQVNGGCIGTRKDADAINIAMRLASMGYVAAVADYRLGWNPVATSQTLRTAGIINAAYRGVQDAKTAIRFFKKTVAEDENPYGIDPEKIVLWGLGTAGYISFASATLDTITDTYIDKFVTPAGPMVFEPANGDVDGTKLGLSIEGLPYPTGDTLNLPNHVEYSSDFQLAVNLGGALGDTSWIDADDVPTISFHVPTDPYAPCEDGLVIVPPPVELPVVEVFGSCAAQPLMTMAGVNAIFADADYTDPISEKARGLNGGLESLYLFQTDDPNDSAPWQYAFSLEPYGVANSDCDTNSVISNLYLDTIMAYYAPRACFALDLGPCTESAAVDLIPAAEVGLKMMPNPATSQVLIQTAAEFPVSDFRLFDLNGRMLEHRTNVNNNQIRLERKGLPAGVYVVKLRIKDRVVAQKLVFN